MIKDNKSIRPVIACSIFEQEIKYLLEIKNIDGNFIFVDSDLHMNPEKLEEKLEKLIEPGYLLCYGDCHARITNQDESGIINKVKGVNCIEIFLGRETYRKLRSEGAFFLLPEWTMKWEHIFKDLLGFSDASVASEFMNEMHKKIIYLNTGVVEIPLQTLDIISKYFLLPVEVMDVNLTHLEFAINDGLKLLEP